MKNKVDLTKVELEGLDLVDLGDAAEETRQHNPWPLVNDSIYGLGEWAR